MPNEFTRISVDGHQLAAVCLNPGAPGEPVILLHGITSSISFWQTSPAPYLLELGPCYAHPDLPEAIHRSLTPYRQLDLDALLPYFRHMPDIDITPQLSAIQSPTLLIAGDRDPIVPPAQSQQIARHIPQADLVMLAGAGHLPFLERPVEYHRQVSAWLAQSQKHKQ